MILLLSKEFFKVLLTTAPTKNPGYVPDVLAFLRTKPAKTNKHAAKPRAQKFSPQKKILRKTTGGGSGGERDLFPLTSYPS